MTLETIRTFSNYFQWAGSCLILLSCLPLFKQRQPYIKVLFFYSLSSIVFQLGQQMSIFFAIKINNLIGNGFVFFEAVLFGLMFWFATRENRLRNVIAAAIGLYVLYYIGVLLFLASTSFSLLRFGRDFVLVVLSIGYFYYLIKKLPEDNLLNFPMFWINASVLFFFSGTFILSLMLDYIVKVLGDDLSSFWTFRNFFRFGFCLVLTYAGWLDLRLLKVADRQ